MRKIVEDHWKYVEALTRATLLLRRDIMAENASVGFTIDEIIALIGFHYKSAFIHGWKHALEAQQSKNLPTATESTDATCVENIIKNDLVGLSPKEDELLQVLTFLREDR